MLQDKVELEGNLIEICRRNRFEIHRQPTRHAGGKMLFVYPSLMGNKGRIEIDMNYMYRVPIYDIQFQSAVSWRNTTNQISILDIHELAAGKLHALLEREASRDLFDSHYLLTKCQMDLEKIRLIFTIYAAMRKNGWKNLSLDLISYNVQDIRECLLPVLDNLKFPGQVRRQLKHGLKTL